MLQLLLPPLLLLLLLQWCSIWGFRFMLSADAVRTPRPSTQLTCVPGAVSPPAAAATLQGQM